jgi:hypothetical protein
VIVEEEEIGLSELVGSDFINAPVPRWSPHLMMQMELWHHSDRTVTIEGLEKLV